MGKEVNNGVTMDLRLYGRVLWRFRYLVLAGWMLGTLLAFVSVVRIGGDGLSYRQDELFTAEADIFVNQQGFPWGRSFVPDINADDPAQVAKLAGQAGDPDRLAALAEIYEQLAQGDQVRDIMLRGGPIEGTLLAQQFTADRGRRGLPLLRLSAEAESPELAIALVTRQTAAFRQYLRAEQNRASIPPRERVVLSVVRGATQARVTQPRSFTPAIVVFLGVLIATVATAFTAENIWPRSRGAAPRQARVGDELTAGKIEGQVLVPGDDALEERRRIGPRGS